MATRIERALEATGSRLIDVTATSKRKEHKTGDAAAIWVHETQYDTPEDGED